MQSTRNNLDRSAGPSDKAHRSAYADTIAAASDGSRLERELRPVSLSTKNEATVPPRSFTFTVIRGPAERPPCFKQLEVKHHGVK